MPTQRTSKGKGGRGPRAKRWLRAVLLRLRSVARWCCVRARAALTGIRERLRRVPAGVEVLIAEAQRRRRLHAEIQAALGRLRRTVPIPAGGATVGAVVAAQHVLAGGKQVAGCVHVRHRDGGGTTALIRVALHAHGRDLRDDEVLAVLAEQWIGLAMNAGGAGGVVPTDLVPEDPAPPAKPTSAPPAAVRRRDPLLSDADWALPPEPHANGRARA